MQRNSVSYILAFCAGICLICSILVSSTAVGLKERQDTNKVLDRQKKVLSVASLMKDGAVMTAEEVDALLPEALLKEEDDLLDGTETQPLDGLAIGGREVRKRR